MENKKGLQSMSTILVGLVVIVIISFIISVFLTRAISGVSEKTVPPISTTTPPTHYGIQTKTSDCTANQVLPDSACTPGAILTTDASVVCVSGYAISVRDVPLEERKQAFLEYGIPYTDRSNYELDHLISLELGGSNDISNLWPEPHNLSYGSFTKDKFENHLHDQVCSGKLSLTQAQYEISSNWTAYNY